MRPRRLAVALLVVTAAAYALVSVLPPGGGDAAVEHVDDVDLTRPAEGASAIWPYTSRSPSVHGRTLAVNVVVVGEPAAVRRALTARTDAAWNLTGNDTGATVDAGGIDWRGARGAARYTYVRPQEEDGRWIASDYQLGHGAYLGARYHVRAYVSSDDEWTALQAHREYWDWFRLRHTVSGVADAGAFVEADLGEEPFVTDVRRVPRGGSGGELTLVEMALASALLGGVGAIDRTSLRRAARRLHGMTVSLSLGLALGALYLGVRVAGLALESALPGVDPRLFAAVLYPALVAGTPAIAWRLARGRRPAAAFVLAVAGLGIAIAVDFAALGVGVPPDRLAIHRLALLAAVGTIAVAGGGSPGSGRGTLAIGLLGWIAVLLAPLAGVV